MNTKNLHWKEAIENEDRLRLKWFINNEQKLRESANVTNKSDETGKLLQESFEIRKTMINERDKHPRRKIGDLPNECPPDFIGYMKPVPEEIRNLLYKSSNVGRVTYLKERLKINPEDKYYSTETSGFVYGWKMGECSKTMSASKFGRCFIIDRTFYRRRAGIEADPKWYRNPSRTSPTVCNG